MRKVHQDKILELLQTLAEACGQLQKQSSATVLCGLLADMQDFALEIGKFIESVEGEGTRTVGLIGELCRILYMAYCEKSVADYNGQLETQIYHIIDSVQYEFKPVKIEAAFFPYKLSMADSLETIWDAAMEDPDCDVVICPIPYYDRLPDGTLGEMHYEGDGYPENLPIVDWRKYDVKAHHPDIIFIHSPYDEGNYVTSVHPDFYCKRLRECTDMLVYSPYFLVVGDISKELCITAASIYADKIIVQSERVCHSYVNAFQEAFGTRFGDAKKKFVPLGSPKFDKALGAKRENYKLPGKWEGIIAEKKAVLYNTSLSSMLRDSERYLTKIEDILECFRKRGDVVLWWRPHPLFEAALDSMRPGLAGKYREIVRLYNQEAYGIYDDTPDLYRSIAWCDAYYGDSASSLLPLWLVTGKPLLIQDVHCMSDCVKNIDVPLSETAFSPESRWKEVMESPDYPQYNLPNLQDALAAGRLIPVDGETLFEKYGLSEGEVNQRKTTVVFESLSLKHTLFKEGAGRPIYQYIKKLVKGGRDDD